jgi:hypothetical protein
MSGNGDEPGRTRKTVIAAALVFLGFGALAALMPNIMLRLGQSSLWAAGLAAALFIVLPFLLIAWRVRSQKGRN